jgi:hypothetical protein
MRHTTSGTLETHQDVYEWWRSKKGEITESIQELRESGTVEEEILSLMEGMLNDVKLRTKFIDYFDEEL